MAVEPGQWPGPHRPWHHTPRVLSQTRVPGRRRGKIVKLFLSGVDIWYLLVCNVCICMYMYVYLLYIVLFISWVMASPKNMFNENIGRNDIWFKIQRYEAHVKRCTQGITLGISKVVRKPKLFVVIHVSTGRRHFQDTLLPFGHDLLYPTFFTIFRSLSHCQQAILIVSLWLACTSWYWFQETTYTYIHLGNL